MKYVLHESGNPESNDLEFDNLNTALKYARTRGWQVDGNTRLWGAKAALDGEGIFLGLPGSADTIATIKRGVA